MKDKKKMKVTEHADGSTTYSPTSGVGFYNPFCLLKKDFNYPTNLAEGMRNSFLMLKILTSIDQTNRITTAAIQSCGLNFGMKKTSINNFINGLVEYSILIKISQGCYKVNESLVIFKQDHEGYLALQKETQALTQNNQTINNNGIIINNPSLKVVDRLLEAKAEQDRQHKLLNI